MPTPLMSWTGTNGGAGKQRYLLDENGNIILDERGNPILAD